MSDPMRYLGSLRVVEDAGELARAGNWVMLKMTPRSMEVRGLVPDVFEDYARIFHPAMREVDARDLPLSAPGLSATGIPVCALDDDVLWREVSWQEVADANGKIAHPAMQWPSITGCDAFAWSGAQPGLWERHPQRDSLPLRLTDALCEILAAFTNTPQRCWGAVWEGYGDMVGLRSDATLPRLALWNRPMIVGSGSLSGIPERPVRDGWDDVSVRPAERYQSPSLWWADDRAWCVATDVDMDTTYIGASADCVDCLMNDGRLEVMRVEANQGVTLDSDTINPISPRASA